MQHPEIEEASCTASRPIRDPQPDGKSALAIDPELIVSGKSKPPRSNRVRAGIFVLRTERARARLS